jgi:hypothetical protein
LTHLKTIKRPKINNSELLGGVDRVSRSIEGCIKFAESAIGLSTSQQNLEVLNPPQKWSGDILSGIDQVDSKLIHCIKIAEGTLLNMKQKLGGGICGGSGETNPWLVRMGPSISRIPQNPSPKPAHIRTPEPAESSFDQDFDQFMNHSMISKTGLITSTCSWALWPIHPNMLTLFGNWQNSRENQSYRTIQCVYF